MIISQHTMRESLVTIVSHYTGLTGLVITSHIGVISSTSHIDLIGLVILVLLVLLVLQGSLYWTHLRAIISLTYLPSAINLTILLFRAFHRLNRVTSPRRAVSAQAQLRREKSSTYRPQG